MTTPCRFDPIRVLTVIGIGLTLAILNAAMVAKGQLDEMSEPGRATSQTRANVVDLVSQSEAIPTITLATLETNR